MIDVLDRINELRKERSWTIYKLAEESMVSQSTMSNLFARKSMPSIYTLSQICDAFGITLSEFFEEDRKIADETRILAVYRQLNEKDRATVVALAEVLRKNKQ